MKKLLLTTTALCAVVGLHATAPSNPPINVAFAETGAGPTSIMLPTYGFHISVQDGGMISEPARGEMLLGETGVVAKRQGDAGLIEAPTKDYGLASMTVMSSDMKPKLAIAVQGQDVGKPLDAKKVVDLATMVIMSTDATPPAIHDVWGLDRTSLVAVPKDAIRAMLATVGRSSSTALTTEVA